MANKTIEITTNSAKETEVIAEQIAKHLKGGEKIALFGNLGSGKTVFAKGIAKGLKIKKKITSPTFVLARQYQYSDKPRKFFYHLDIYRLKKSSELENLGLVEMMESKNDIVLIEWAEKAKKFFPKGSIQVRLTPKKGGSENVRKITIWPKE